MYGPGGRDGERMERMGLCFVDAAATVVFTVKSYIFVTVNYFVVFLVNLLSLMLLLLPLLTLS